MQVQHADSVQVVGIELATTAQSTVTLRSEKGLAHATSGKFRVKECHVDLENTAKWLGQLRDSQLRTCLRTVTLNDWSVMKEDALLFFEECCSEGVFQVASLAGCSSRCPDKGFAHSVPDASKNKRCHLAGAFPELDTMNFRRVIPTQLMLPSQITRVGLEEIRPPYGNLPAGASGQFYVVSLPRPPQSTETHLRNITLGNLCSCLAGIPCSHSLLRRVN